MSPARDPDEADRDPDLYDEEAPRSIFSAMWFRAVLVVLVLGVIGVVAVPYLLDIVNPPPKATGMKGTQKPTTTDGAGTRPGGTPAPVVSPQSATTSTAATTPPAPATAPAPAATPPTPAPAPSAKATEPAKAQVAKTEPAKSDAPKAEPRKTTAAAKPATATAAKTTTRATASGQYYVQVGAFRDAEAAKKVAARLREQNYRVNESVTGGSATDAAASRAPAAPSPADTPGVGDRYDVFISGTSPADINAKVAAKGLAAESVAGGVVVKPSLPLRDAVALSKDLAADGLKVQVRRAAGAGGAAAPAAKPAPAARASVGGGATLYRVRVGGYNDRAAATTALNELKGKGFPDSFIARGTE